MKIIFLISIGLFILSMLAVSQPDYEPADYVDPFIGVKGEGACMPGPCLPNASIYPSPNTLNADNGGYNWNEKIVGFAQLHAQGTGGLTSYGNFLISPQIGLQIIETKHASLKTDERAKCYVYEVLLKDYGIKCALTPSSNAAIYKFTFPASDSSSVLIDIARKINGMIGLDSGYIELHPETNKIYGGGIYKSNWPSNETKWKMFFCMMFSKSPDRYGVWQNTNISPDQLSGTVKNNRLGGYFMFHTKADEEIFVKIAVSFKSKEHAEDLLIKEIPDWDFEKVKDFAKNKWNEMLSKIYIEASEKEKTIFYTNLFHCFVQPRNRTGNNTLNTNEPFWDDHYTLWDSWQTLFPLMSIINPDMVSATINSFISRYKRNKYVADAFINGQENAVGQGGNTVDNIIADAFVKHIPNVDWYEAYKILKYNADSMRTRNYILNGYHFKDEKNDYSWRMKSGSGTLGFAYNDFCVAEVALGLNYTDDYRKYLARSANWLNVWNDKAASDGYTGFMMAKKQDGTFDEIDPKKGYNDHFYEGTCWEYSYAVPHNMDKLIELMGGSEQFVKRLTHALQNHYIDFGNEPSFLTLWLFCHDMIKRPDLCLKYLKEELLPKYTDTSLPGDDDQGAMGALYVFAMCGFYPVAGQDMYYLHGASYKKIIIHLPNNKEFVIKTENISAKNNVIRSVRLNGVERKNFQLTHKDIMNGGVLEFVMNETP